MQRQPGGASFHELQIAVATIRFTLSGPKARHAWSAGVAAPEHGRELAIALGRLCDLLGLPGGAPAPDADPLTTLHALRDRRLAGIGTPLGGPHGEAWLTTLYRVEARNGLLLDQFLERIAGSAFAKLADAGAAHARLKRLRTSREGITAVGRALRIWIDDSDSLPERSFASTYWPSSRRLHGGVRGIVPRSRGDLWSWATKKPIIVERDAQQYIFTAEAIVQFLARS